MRQGWILYDIVCCNANSLVVFRMNFFVRRPRGRNTLFCYMPFIRLLLARVVD